MSGLHGPARGVASPPASSSPPPRVVALLIVLALLSCAWLAVRLHAASVIGFGDSEALYASYALHPQPMYLDHPGLVGLLARAIGHGLAPSPVEAHVVTAVLSTVVPFVMLGAARATGASWSGALRAGLASACIPELTVGLFGLTPDLLLGLAWPSVLGLASLGLASPVGGALAASCLLLAGLIAGVAAVAKVTGIFLLVALVAVYVRPHARRHARTIWPWAGLAAAVLLALPAASFELGEGFPMLRHRLVDTQVGAGPSLRNLGALLGGQLAYLSPLVAWLAVPVAVDLVKHREDDDTTRLLFASFAYPLLPLVLLALVSRVAEPHWLAPPLVALLLHDARVHGRIATRPALGRWALGLALSLSIAVYAWTLVPAAARLRPESVDPRADLATELYGWPEPLSVVRDLVASERARDEQSLAVAGPHWTVCAQLHAGLGPEIPVGCDTPIADDFDDWLPREVWRHADKIVWVTDSRFPDDAATRFPHRFRVMGWTLAERRGGRVVRTFRIALLERRAQG